MSVRPQEVVQASNSKETSPVVTTAARKKITIQSLRQLAHAKTPIAMLTAYDFPTGRACEAYGVDVTLVGDSLAQVCLGYDSTTRLTMDEMTHHTRAVSRGSTIPLLVADMPFGSYHASAEDAVRNAVRLVSEGHAEAVKMEGGEEIAGTVRRLTGMGIPVMAHVGLLPQRHTSLSGYKVQGRTAASAQGVLHSALALQDAGAFSIVLEAIPHRLGTYITSKLAIPTIGIGAGPGCSGQVLVWSDVMSTWAGHKAKFVRRFADVQAESERGVRGYISAVREGTFPDPKREGYEMDIAEWELLLKMEGDEGWSGPSAM
ncbi:ketopantoate hydroxymethyltransferase [Athelia psychrophila]|uniref:3-methyl-2-oxobutanoate hydroxymethyltransferase n=1 Tax=Athelia psychrophila TaxID=1759441 RepID=A0A166CKD4_9AGAM|nr:ketopantoate hydroxymethyltransferase [Fibularhizoctonia sp. CBS 109695]